MNELREVLVKKWESYIEKMRTGSIHFVHESTKDMVRDHIEMAQHFISDLQSLAAPAVAETESEDVPYMLHCGHSSEDWVEDKQPGPVSYGHVGHCSKCALAAQAPNPSTGQEEICATAASAMNSVVQPVTGIISDTGTSDARTWRTIIVGLPIIRKLLNAEDVTLETFKVNLIPDDVLLNAKPKFFDRIILSPQRIASTQESLTPAPNPLFCNRCEANLCEHDNCTDWTCARACSRCARRSGLPITAEELEDWREDISAPASLSTGRLEGLVQEVRMQAWDDSGLCLNPDLDELADKLEAALKDLPAAPSRCDLYASYANHCAIQKKVPVTWHTWKRQQATAEQPAPAKEKQS